MKSESAAGTSHPPTPTRGSGQRSCKAVMKSESTVDGEMRALEEDLEDPLQTFLLHLAMEIHFSRDAFI